MEGVPFRLAMSLFLMAIILVVSFSALFVFLNFNSNKAFSDDVNSVISSMQTLKRTSDEGSFLQVKLQIPEKSNITFDNTTSNITYYLYGEKFVVHASGSLLWFSNYSTGSYELELYYGTPEKTQDEAPFLIPFK